MEAGVASLGMMMVVGRQLHVQASSQEGSRAKAAVPCVLLQGGKVMVVREGTHMAEVTREEVEEGRCSQAGTDRVAAVPGPASHLAV
jgi:hypothetical protein